jgi:hypothetical protein
VSGVSGDFAKLNALTHISARLDRARAEASRRTAKAITEVIEREFKTGTDPRGVPWRPLKASTLARGRRPPPLTDSGAMRASVFVYPARLDVSIASPAGFHQSGTRYMASRPIVPTGQNAAKWVAAIHEAVRGAFDSTR